MQLPNSGYHDITGYYTWMGPDGIARTVVKADVSITIVEAKENSSVVNGLSEGSYPLIVDTRKIYNITKEARDHFSVQDRETSILSIAILVDSHLSRMVANFFLGLNKSRLPVRIFTSESKAASWSEQFKVSSIHE